MKMKKTYLVFGLLFVMLLFSGIASAWDSPVLSNEVPTDESTLIETTVTSVNVTIYTANTSVNWTIDFTPDIGSSSGTYGENGSKTCSISGLLYGTTYTWVVSAFNGNGTDESANYTNATYTFTTRSEQRLTEHTTDPAQILLVGVLSIVLILGLVVYVMKSFKEGTFKFETFITLLIAVIVISIAVSYL